MIHVAFGISDAKGTYSKYVAVTMVSVLEHTRDDVTFHILCDDTLSEMNKNLLRQTAESYGAIVVYHKVDLDQKITSLDSLKDITIGTLFRLMLPMLCPEIQKIVYLDGDVLVQLDIKELWNTNLENRCLGVVKDAIDTQRNFVDNGLYKRLDVDANCYFNAGVLVMNLEEIRRNVDLGKEGIRILKEYPQLPFADQDVLNILFQKHMMGLSMRYNFQVNLLDATLDYSFLEQPRILHFSGLVKPWFAPQPLVQKLYYSYMAKTAYVQSTEDLLDIMSDGTRLYKEKVTLKQALLHYHETGRTLRILSGMRFIFSEKLYWKILAKALRWKKKWLYR